MFIIVINIVILIVLLIYILKNFNNLSRTLNISLLLVLGGGIGNLIDRIFRGYVIDYIDVNNLLKFPIFNIADILVVIGIVIIIICLFLEETKNRSKV